MLEEPSWLALLPAPVPARRVLELQVEACVKTQTHTNAMAGEGSLGEGRLPFTPHAPIMCFAEPFSSVLGLSRVHPRCLLRVASSGLKYTANSETAELACVPGQGDKINLLLTQKHKIKTVLQTFPLGG